MSQDNQLRTLIELGAFSHIIGGGEIPEDLEVNSVTACRVQAGYGDFSEVIAGSVYTNGPIVFNDCSAGASNKIESVNGDPKWDNDLIHTVGTRTLQNNLTLRSGKYYYLNTAENDCRCFSGIEIHCNETAEIWIEVGSVAPQNLKLPGSWRWIGTEMDCLRPYSFYDIAVRNVKGIDTFANVAFSYERGCAFPH